MYIAINIIELQKHQSAYTSIYKTAIIHINAQLQIVYPHITCSPAMMALVDAMAGMMLPAIPLALYRDWAGMPNTAARRFEAAVTKRMAMASSLSKARDPSTGVAEEVSRLEISCTQWKNSKIHCSVVHTC